MSALIGTALVLAVLAALGMVGATYYGVYRGIRQADGRPRTTRASARRRRADNPHLRRDERFGVLMIGTVIVLVSLGFLVVLLLPRR